MDLDIHAVYHPQPPPHTHTNFGGLGLTRMLILRLNTYTAIIRERDTTPGMVRLKVKKNALRDGI